MFTDEQFTCLVTRYIDTVYRVAFNYLKSPADADDITQTVFEKLLMAKITFESDEHIRNWLIRVTINACKKVLRSPWHRNESFDTYAGTLAFQDPAHSELFFAVMDLPKKYRIPIYLHYYEEYSTQEIAQILKIPKNTVCTHLKRGRELLKKQLQEAFDDV